MLDLIAWERQGYCHSMSPRLKLHSQQAHAHRAHVYTTYVDTYIHTYIHVYIHTEIYMAGHIDHRHSEHPHKHSTNGLILLPSLAEKNGGPPVRICVCVCIHTCTRCIPPAVRFRHSICPVAGPGSPSPQLLAFKHKSPWDSSPTPVAVTDCHTHTRSRLGFLWFYSWPPHALSPIDTVTFSHPEPTKTPLAP